MRPAVVIHMLLFIIGHVKYFVGQRRDKARFVATLTRSLSSLGRIMILRIDNVTISKIKTIDRQQFSTDYLPHDSAWGMNGERPWTIIECGQTQLGLNPNQMMFVRVSESRSNKPSQIHHLAVMEAISNHTVALMKLDRHVRSKDLKAISDISDIDPMGERERNPVPLVDSTNPLDLFASQSIDWMQSYSDFDLNMTDLASQKILNSQLEDPTSNSISDPVQLILERYVETLYSERVPLVYFAKSTLPKAKLLFGGLSDKFIQTLQSMLLSIDILDRKYSLLHEADTADVCRGALDADAWRQWLDTNMSSDENLTRARVDQLKVRETELQVTLLLEILANSSFIGESAQLEPAKPAGKPKPRLVRKKKNAQSDEVSTNMAGKLNPSLKPAVALDILFDRLCIHNALQATEPTSDSERPKSTDLVRHFCFEIILPFYSSKLPDKSRELVAKARGPSSNSKLATRSSSTATDPIQTSIVDMPMETETNDSIMSSTETASRKGSTRGGLPVTDKDQQKRQVSFNVGSKRAKRDLSADLAQAIKNISKPNRAAAVAREEFHILRPAKKPSWNNRPATKKIDESLVQVQATPARKRTMQPPRMINASPTTPKRQRLNFVAETPSKSDITPTKLVLDTPISKVPETPSK